jgi:hypothetical protein
MDSVDFSTDVRLSRLVRQQLSAIAERFTQRLRTRYNLVRLHLHLKPEGAQVACNLSLSTDEGRFFAHASGWDARKVLADALSGIEIQVEKRMQRAQAY